MNASESQKLFFSLFFAILAIFRLFSQFFSTFYPKNSVSGHLDIDQPLKLPPNLRWSRERDKIFRDVRTHGLRALTLHRLDGNFRSFPSLQDLNKSLLVPAMRKQKFPGCIWRNWQRDEEFGRQFLDGIQPRALNLVKSVSTVSLNSVR